MEKRKRAGVIAASGVAISGSAGSLIATHHGSSGGLSDFWMGCIVGIAVGLAVLALLGMTRGRSFCRFW